uniref:Uncharacterized protein n=1 Tax=Plectus sambesii TaxID=2011161 RepID=A0A914WD25_9BILA
MVSWASSTDRRPPPARPGAIAISFPYCTRHRSFSPPSCNAWSQNAIMLLHQLLSMFLFFGRAPCFAFASNATANLTVYKIAVFIDTADGDDFETVEREVLQIFHNVTNGTHDINGKTFALTAQTVKAREG